MAEYYVNVEKRQSSRSSVRVLVFVSARGRSKCSAGARMPEVPLPEKEGNAFDVGSSCTADTYKLIGPRHTLKYQGSARCVPERRKKNAETQVEGQKRRNTVEKK